VYILSTLAHYIYPSGLVHLLLFSLWFDRYFPFGVNGMLAGSAVVFFSFIGFDVVASTAEEVIFNVE